MNLFPDTDIFRTPPFEKIAFDLPDTELVLWKGFFTQERSDAFYRHLLEETSWMEHKMDIYNATHVIPRMIAWYEDCENIGSGNNPPLTPVLNEIREEISLACGHTFNSVLLNLYRNGEDGVSWHSDREENFGRNAIIGSVTFGETRPFRLRHKTRKDLSIEIPLTHGSFLLMAGTTQTHWEHQIPKTKKKILPRINLTFRTVRRK